MTDDTTTTLRHRIPLDITPILRRDPDAPPFPPFTEEPEIVPRWVWRIGQVVAIGVAVLVITLLFVAPEDGLVLWWLWLLPSVPMIWVLAPGIWRNVCPMATLNQLPRLLGISRNVRLPDWALKHSYLFAVVFYFGGISVRAPLFDHEGPPLAVLMLVALGAALAGGLVFTGKSGWCGTFCPLGPIQKLYGQTPQVVIRNAHCDTCVGCIKNCLDFNPRVAGVADVSDEDRQWVSYRKVFAGAFPGFVLAFFTIPPARVAEPVPPDFDVLRFYALTGLAMLVSLGLFLLVEALFPRLSTTTLVMAFGMLGLNVHNVLRFTTTWRVDKPSWVLIGENVAVLAITATVLVRTWRQERRIHAEARAGTPGLPLPPSAATAAGAHEVVVDDGPAAAVPDGTTLAAAARQAKSPLPSGCGSGVCGADPVRICSGAAALTPPTPQEAATLARLGLDRPDVRLACSARVHGPVALSTEIPDDVPVPEPVRDTPRVVVVGNGVAGMTVADEVRRRDPEMRVYVVAAEARVYYNRMAIAALIHGTSGTTGLQMVPDDWARTENVDVRLNTHAVGIDREHRRLMLGTGESLGYDTLVLATGSDAARPDLPGTHLPGVFVLRTADDAIHIRAYAQQHGCRRSVVLGAGLLGLEAAHGMRRLGLESAVVTGGKRLLSRQLDERASALLADHMRAEGVELLDGPAAAAVLGDGRAQALRLTDGREVPLDMLIMCIGAAPRTTLAQNAGLEVSRGVLVDDRMRTTDDRILAVGDVAEHRGQVPGLWAVASEQAEVAAATITGDTTRWASPTVFAAVLKDVGLDVLSIGRVEPSDGDEVVAGEPGRPGGVPVYHRLVLSGSTVVGAVVIGDRAVGEAAATAVRERTELSPDALRRVRADPSRITDVS